MSRSVAFHLPRCGIYLIQVWHQETINPELTSKRQPRVSKLFRNRFLCNQCATDQECCSQSNNSVKFREYSEDQRVAEILGQIGREQGDVVFQTHKAGSDDLQTAAVILKKAVIDGGCQRDQLEYREDDKERCNEDIAPFRVADRPFLLCFFSHEISLLPGHSKTKGAGEIRRPPLCFNFQFGVKPLMRAIPRRSARGTSP